MINRQLSYILTGILTLLFVISCQAKNAGPDTAYTWIAWMMLALIALISAALWTVLKARNFFINRLRSSDHADRLNKCLVDLDANQIALLKETRELRSHLQSGSLKKHILLLIGLFVSNTLLAQAPESNDTLFTQPGVIITIVLILIPLTIAVLFLLAMINRMINRRINKEKELEAQQLADHLLQMDEDEIDALLPSDAKDKSLRNVTGMIQGATTKTTIRFVATKKKAMKRPNIDPQLSKLIIWYLGCAAFWLVFGTTIGEYLGIKFVAPDVDHQSWLSFGRLRPVHTNAVFWGWSSLAMLGLGHYVVTVVSNTPLASLKKGWIALWLINAAVVLGTASLMMGINNGGGEYREYVWPVMALFGGGLLLSLINFIQTVAKRITREIYISNWYIISALMFTLVITVIAYWPTWQNGLGETIVQGYYMHQGVGMWFMLFSLGIVYYFLPQQLNKPIYSYSLGILAFWTQIIFYTVIGTHHFVFSSIPWTLQTIAIVGSMGMVIPVIAGTTNFLMTFKGDFNKIAGSYTLPFYLVGIVFYFTGSFQGTAEAFRYTNLLWHFTDFTVAHSHITMYGIIAFLLWGSIYALIPRLTGKEPSQVMIGAHFWMAFIGLLFYSVPLMIGGTLRGLMWMEGRPFMESVTMMFPYWLWRAIGGTMMWLSHLIFAYNFYRMVSVTRKSDIKSMAFEKIKAVNNEMKQPVSVN